jgi:hypothetical protein
VCFAALALAVQLLSRFCAQLVLALSFVS